MAKIKAKVFQLFLFFLFSTSFSLSKDFISILDEGDNYYKNFENLKALEKYEEAYKLDTNNYEALSKLTRTYNDVSVEFKEQRNKEEADKYIKLAVKYAEIFKDKFPDSAQVYSYLAWSYGGMARLVSSKEKIKLAKKIEENAQKSIQLEPNNFLPYLILGVYYREVASLSWIEKLFANTFFGDAPEGTYEDSEKMLKKVLSLNPNIITAEFELGRTYLEMDKEKEAIELFNKVIDSPIYDFRDKYTKAKAKRIIEGLKS